MSRLSRFLREIQPSCWLRFLLYGTRLFNTLLMLVGIAELVYAGDSYVTAAGDPQQLWPPIHPPLSSVVFAAMGLITFLSAVAALHATSVHSLPLLNIHLALLALLLASQVCLASAVATVNADGSNSGGKHVSNRLGSSEGGSLGASSAVDSSPHRLPADVAFTRRELHDALLEYKWADGVALITEVLTLMFGCLLQSAYTRADERAEDLEEGLGGGTSAPLLTSSRREAQQQAGGSRAQLPPRIQRNDSWSRRMREQYGVDTSFLTYDPLAPHNLATRGSGAQGAAESGQGGRRGSDAASRRCVIS